MGTKIQKIEKQSCLVSGFATTLLRIARVGGIAPLNFQKSGSGWKIQLSQGWISYGYILATVIVVSAITSIAADIRQPSDDSVRMDTRTKSLVWILDAASVVVIAVTSVVRAPHHARDLIVTCNKVEKINLELSMRHWPLHREKRKTNIIYFWLFVTIVLCSIDLAYLVWRIDDLDSVKLWICVGYSSHYVAMTILQLREMIFITVTIHVMHCLRDINNHLMTLLRELTSGNELPLMSLLNECKLHRSDNLVSRTIADTGMVTAAKSPNHCETVRRLTRAYARSCDIVQEVDTTHGFVVLMMLGFFLLQLVCTPYYLVAYMFRDTELAKHPDKRLLYVSWQFVWCIYYIVRMLTVIEPCHLTHVEMETTRELVSHLIRCPPSMYDPLSLELDLFFKQLLLNQATYSAMRTTVISRTLVATILGSVTTYLVIILQLQ